MSGVAGIGYGTVRALLGTVPGTVLGTVLAPALAWPSGRKAPVYALVSPGAMRAPRDTPGTPATPGTPSTPRSARCLPSTQRRTRGMAGGTVGLTPGCTRGQAG